MAPLVDPHNHIFPHLSLVVVLIVYISGMMLLDYVMSVRGAYASSRVRAWRNLYFANTAFTEWSDLELVWTAVPSAILILIAIPSFQLLFETEEVHWPALTLKIIGHQWYWGYEITDHLFNLTDFAGAESLIEEPFDSYLRYESDLDKGDHRLLQVDTPLYLTRGGTTRAIVTSMDVLHSWSVPALGIKIDAVPGRLNEVSFGNSRIGTFYGMCSELCGVNHGYMPITVIVPKDLFFRFWWW
jgi:heme/copper-type cytochrome/quinol oxidase subunit 2